MPRRRRPNPEPTHLELNFDQNGIYIPDEEFWSEWRKWQGPILTKYPGIKGCKLNRNQSEKSGYPVWIFFENQHTLTHFFADLKDLPKNPEVESLPDHLESGLYSPAASTNLEVSAPDEYDRRRDFEEDGHGFDAPAEQQDQYRKSEARQRFYRRYGHYPEEVGIE